MNRALVISDIAWEREDDPINHFIKIITDTGASDVIFLGDIISDGCNHYIHTNELISLIHKIRGKPYFRPKIYILWGNHDLDEEIEIVEKEFENNKKVRFINNIFFNWNGFKCLGVNSDTTDSQKNIKEFYRKNCNKKVDIIFTHCRERHRIFLLQWKPKLMITGHYGFGESKVNDTRLISNSQFPDFYTTIQHRFEKRFFIDQYHNGISIEAYWKEIREKYRMMMGISEGNKKLGKQFEQLLKAKEEYWKLQNKNDKIDFFEELIRHIPYTHIKIFIADSKELDEARKRLLLAKELKS